MHVCLQFAHNYYICDNLNVSFLRYICVKLALKLETPIISFVTAFFFFFMLKNKIHLKRCPKIHVIY